MVIDKQKNAFLLLIPHLVQNDFGFIPSDHQFRTSAKAIHGCSS
jgi:hypothetical protein